MPDAVSLTNHPPAPLVDQALDSDNAHADSRANATPDLVYIAGYGRSGSTLLDTLLGSHRAMFGGGELFFLFENLRNDADCSCGMPMSACSFWTEVLDHVRHSLPDFDLATAHEITRACEKMFGSDRLLDDYQRLWSTVLASIRRVSGATCIVDSSKSCRWATRRVTRLADLSKKLRVIHLVRDPRAVMWSCRRGKNTDLESGQSKTSKRSKTSSLGMFRGLAGWLAANRSFDRTRRQLPSDSTLRIHYEELVERPTDTLQRLTDFLGIDLSDVAKRLQHGADFSAGHGVGGNRMRRNGAIRLRPDQEWRERLPISARMAVTAARPFIPKQLCVNEHQANGGP